MLANLLQLFESAGSGLVAVQRALAFWGPVTALPAVAGPLFALASLVTLALLSGVAVAALSIFLVAMVALYLMLTEVFGFSVDFALA